MTIGVTSLFMCGDVMTGRGIDQILPHPGNPELREAYVKDARRYVELAQAKNGAFPLPVDLRWPWGDALALIDERAPDVRLINVETSITRSGDFWPRKAVNYRMSPANIGCITAVRPDAVALANNHVLDFGYAGLEETLKSLAASGLAAAGAGSSDAEAQRPVTVQIRAGARVLLFSCGMPTSGIPLTWGATAEQAGVNLIRNTSAASADTVAGNVARFKQAGDIAVVSIHWGSNWGYEVAEDQILFARRLIDGGVDLIHGHSSHHPRPIEVYRGKLILYGCGDFIDDYEGISGHESFPDVRVAYFASIDTATGALIDLELVPMTAHKMSLITASPADQATLRDLLASCSADFGTTFELSQIDPPVLRIA